MRDREPPDHGLGDARGGSAAQVNGETRPAASTSGPDDGSRMLSPARYLAWIYSPVPRQPVLAKLCEIESEVATSLRPGIDHHVAHARLQWWQEECERCVQGRPVHPLTRELVKAFGAPAAGQPSPLAGLSGFVDTAVWDLAGATFETRKELAAYCERWAAAMFETAALQVVRSASGEQAAAAAHVAAAAQAASAAAGAHSTDVPQVASAAARAPRAVSRWRALGAAVREIELLADLAREAHAGRVRVPLDELEQAGVEVNSLAKPPWPAPLATLLRGRHEALRATIGESLATFGREEQPNFRGLFVWAALAWRQSARVQRALPNIILPRDWKSVV